MTRGANYAANHKTRDAESAEKCDGVPPGEILSIRAEDQVVHARLAGDEQYCTGDPVWITFERYHVFEKESGVRLRSYPEPQ